MNKLTAILGLILLLAATQVYSDCGIVSGPYPPASTAGQPVVAGIMNPIVTPPTYANMNGVLNPLTFPGADLGIQINAAIAALPNGGTIQIPTGGYSFATTIQCPVTKDIPIIIAGAGSASELNSMGTTLTYTGNGDAVSQLHTIQNARGCELRDLTLEGSSAGANAIGFHFGGTTYSRTQRVTIRSFKKAGIELEDQSGKWTERYDFHQTSIWNNGIQIWFHTNSGAQNSFMHSKMDVYLNVNGTQTGLLADGGAADLSGEDFQINGNMVGTGAVLAMHGGAFMNFTKLTITTECQNSTGGCTRFDVDAGSQLVAQLFGGTVSGAAPSVFTDSSTTKRGLNLFLVQAAQDRLSATAMYTCNNGFSLAAGASHDLFTVWDWSGMAAGPLAIKTSIPNNSTSTLFNVASNSCYTTPSFSAAQNTLQGSGSPFAIIETCHATAVAGDSSKPAGSTTYSITNNAAVAANTAYSFLNITGFDQVVCY